MNRYQEMLLASAVCLFAVAADSAAGPPESAPEASQEALRQLERDGAYRCRLVIVDARGKRVAELNGIAARSATLKASPADGRSGFEASLKADPQGDGKVEVKLELAERTDVLMASGSTTWKSTNIHLVEKVKLGSQYEVQMPSWQTTRPGPLKLTLLIEQFKADVR